MGAMKELMMDPHPSEPINFQVTFLCPKCGHPAAAFLAMPEDEDSYFGEVTCLNSEEDHEWSVTIRKKGNLYSAQIDYQPDVDVSLTMVDTFFGWEEPLPEPGAYGIFLEAVKDWRSIVKEIAKSDGASSENRMLFSSLYSIMEAYLSDTITGAAFVDTSVQRQMLKLPGLKDQKISLEKVLKEPNIVRDTVKAELQSFSFHNLEKVNWICEAAFGSPILPKDTDERSLVMKSVKKRHDCVHRNGLGKDGNPHTDITLTYLESIETIFKQMANALENAIRTATAKQFFEDPAPDMMKGT